MYQRILDQVDYWLCGERNNSGARLLGVEREVGVLRRKTVNRHRNMVQYNIAPRAHEVDLHPFLVSYKADRRYE